MNKKPLATNNAVERAYEFIYKKTVNFDFLPGERFNEQELASILSMSRAPIREALNRLVFAGMVVAEPGKGFYCRKLSVTELTELLEVRSDIEQQLIKTVCRVISPDVINSLKKEWQEITENQKKTILDELIFLDEQFHIHLAEIAGNGERIKILKNINDRTRFVRAINLENKVRKDKLIREHLELLDILLLRDENKASEFMKNHLQASSDELKQLIREGLSRIYANEVV